MGNPNRFEGQSIDFYIRGVQSVCIEATIVGLLGSWVRFPPQAMSLHKSKTILRTVSNI
jgi:hypothetical protein